MYSRLSHNAWSWSPGQLMHGEIACIVHCVRVKHCNSFGSHCGSNSTYGTQDNSQWAPPRWSLQLHMLTATASQTSGTPQHIPCISTPSSQPSSIIQHQHPACNKTPLLLLHDFQGYIECKPLLNSLHLYPNPTPYSPLIITVEKIKMDPHLLMKFPQ